MLIAVSFFRNPFAHVGARDVDGTQHHGGEARDSAASEDRRVDCALRHLLFRFRLVTGAGTQRGIGTKAFADFSHGCGRVGRHFLLLDVSFVVDSAEAAIDPCPQSIGAGQDDVVQAAVVDFDRDGCFQRRSHCGSGRDCGRHQQVRFDVDGAMVAEVCNVGHWIFFDTAFRCLLVPTHGK